ncbi:MAG: transposase, partial [Planctomycetota bacterium]
MRHMTDPRQNDLFDECERILSPVAYRRIRRGWQGVFRHAILELMPVDILAGEFSPDMGTPTKELYSMAGLLLIKESQGWTRTQAAEAYMFDASVQYALNLEPANQSMSERTIERYEKIFIENDLAARTMARVTSKLVELLDLDTSRQRLDSTHVFSDMAVFGRTRLMGVTIKRFLTQVKRHNREQYDALPEELRSRYAPSVGRLFGDVAK